ncbi:MAG TPA: hypothetical protein VGD42_21090 [Lysobacter sp.]
MTKSGKTAPPAPDPKPGRNPGYPETRPRDRDDVHHPHPRRKPDPDEGGLDREPETGPEPD